MALTQLLRSPMRKAGASGMHSNMMIKKPSSSNSSNMSLAPMKHPDNNPRNSLLQVTSACTTFRIIAHGYQSNAANNPVGDSRSNSAEHLKNLRESKGLAAPLDQHESRGPQSSWSAVQGIHTAQFSQLPANV